MGISLSTSLHFLSFSVSPELHQKGFGSVRNHRGFRPDSSTAITQQSMNTVLEKGLKRHVLSVKYRKQLTEVTDAA